MSCASKLFVICASALPPDSRSPLLLRLPSGQSALNKFPLLLQGPSPLIKELRHRVQSQHVPLM